MPCTYTFRGKKYESYAALAAALETDDSLFDSIIDVLFSREDKGRLANAVIGGMKGTFHPAMSGRADDVSAEDRAGDGYINVQRVPEQDWFKVNGENPDIRMNTEERVSDMVRWMTVSGVAPDEARRRAEEYVNTRWKRVAEDAYKFHEMIANVKDREESSWKVAAAGSSFDSPRLIQMLAGDNGAGAKIYMQFCGGSPDVRNEDVGKGGVTRHRNVIITADLHNVPDGEPNKMIGHADYIAVRDNGKVEIYNVKVSAEPYGAASKKKIDHYRYEMALLRRGLEQQGVDMSNCTLNIIPVQLEYDDKWERIERVNVQNAVPIDMWQGRVIEEAFDSACAPYVDIAVNPVRFDFQSLNEATDILSKIFPGRNFRAEGISVDAERWVNMSWERCNPVPRKGGGWRLTIPDTHEVIEVSDNRTKADNKEFVRRVAESFTNGHESFTGERGAARLADNIRESFTSVGHYDTSGDSANKAFMKELMAPYFFGYKYNEEDGTFSLRWNVIDSPALDAANMVGLVEKGSNVADFFILTPNDPGSSIKFDGVNENILAVAGKRGMPDMNNDEFVMKANWANIEAVRACAILDSLAGAGNLNDGLKLGKLHVICTNGSDANISNGEVYDIASLAKEWSKIVAATNRLSGGKAGLKDRLNTSGVMFRTTDETLADLWSGIVNCGSWSFDVTTFRNFKDIFNGHKEIDGTYRPGLVDAQTGSQKVELLSELLRRLTKELRGEVRDIRDWKAIIAKSREENTFAGNLARMYIAASDMMRVYSGTYVPYETELIDLDRKISRPGVVTEANHQKCVAMVSESIQLINSRVTDMYFDVKPYFDQYYVDCGYGKMRKKILGDTTKIYERLYERDEDGANTFRFKNPYDMTNDLREHERRFLKPVLYELYKVKCDVLEKRLDISGPNDSALVNISLGKMPSNYLDLPLQRASKVSRWSDVKGMLKKGKDWIVGTVTHPVDRLNELFSKITDTSSVDYANGEFARMQMTNRYAVCEDKPGRRAERIAEKGEKWFETDLENVFIDYLYTQRRVEEMNNLMLKVAAVEIHLALKGEQYNDKTNIDRILDSIDRYVKKNVYKGSTMEKQSLYLENAMKGLRKVTSEILFGIAPANAVRDTILGLGGNFVAAVTHYDSSFSASNLAKAYEYVMLDCFKDLKGMGMLNSLNLKYGFSSFDYGNVSTKLKRQGGALYDWNNFLYWTMKGPDYLNRLTLFVARLLEDGSFKAYSSGADGMAVYNWRLDERFSELAKGDAADKTSEKYRRQLGKYYDLIDAFNKENPDLHLKVTDDLPDGYTMRQIRSYKRLGEKLYGAYDAASRSLIENTAIGRNFLFFFAFYNGINEVWFKGTGLDERTLVERRMKDEEGHDLFWMVDERGMTLTTKDTGVPAHEMVSAIDQGIFATLKTMWGALTKEKLSFNEYYDKYVRDNERVKANYRWMLFSMGITAAFTALLAGVVRPAYKRRKEEMDPNALAENIVVEMLYRGWSRSADYFSGPLAILKYFGDSTNPVTYDMGTKMLRDAYKLLAGDQMFGETALSYSAFYRSMQDSLGAFYKDMAQQNGTAMEEEARKREKEQRKGKTSTVR